MPLERISSGDRQGKGKDRLVRKDRGAIMLMLHSRAEGL